MEINVLFIVLNQTEYLEDILDMFMEIGIKGATILDSQGMGRAIGDSEPLFGSIRNIMDGARPYNKTIFTVIEDENIMNQAVEGVHDIVGDIHEPGVGMMFTVPVGNVYGMAKN